MNVAKWKKGTVMVIDTIKKSIGSAAKNWQIVLVHFVLLLFYIAGFMVMVAAPFAVILAGNLELNPQNINDLINVFGNIANLLTQNLVGFAVAMLALLLYLTIVTTVALYVFSATLGMLGKTVMEDNYRFSLSSFMREGRRFFVRVMWLTFFLGLVFLALMIGISIVAGVSSVLLSPLLASDSTPVYFVGIFISLLIASLALGGFVLFAVASAFSLITLVVEDMKAIAAFRKAVAFIRQEPQSILFFLAVTGLYMLAVLGVIIITTPLGFIPLVGPFFSMPISFVCNRFLGLVMIAALIHFYADRHKQPPAEFAEAVDFRYNLLDDADKQL